ncbi:Nudix protein [Venturia nashicola]|uniref:Nudix protein n=1 Tax=Venturia nashicola TaxID=86259 RepID=A0A4Z1NSD2_9PEZI|nr:Nudix protein [Venturia nashicola]
MALDYLDLIKEVENIPGDYNWSDLYKLMLPNDSRPHGFMLPDTVFKMPWTSEFKVDHGSRIVQLNDASDGKDTSKICNAAFQKTVDAAITQDAFEIIHGTHSEPYKVLGSRFPLQVERFSAPLFGIATRGAHMTGYTFVNGEMKIWIPRRSAHLFTYPNKLDTTVAGGVKAQHTPYQCIVEEADEEASLPKDYVSKNAKPVGVLTYMTLSRRSGLIHPDVLYLFDIELTNDLIPIPHDDEVSEFKLMGIEEIKEAMVNREFKSNCNLVMIDFFIRHGILTPDEEPHYVEIQTKLHNSIPFPTAP